MEVIMKNIEELKPYENNPRINDSAVIAVTRSIELYGFRVPIIIDGDGLIIAGHTRYKAALELGMREIPCIVAEGLTDTQIKAFRLADNKTGTMSEWDIEKLLVEIDELITSGNTALEDIGFNENEFQALLSAAESETMRQMSKQDLNNREIDPGEYEEDKFSHQCPRCGFFFN